MTTYDYKTAHGFLTSHERDLLKTLASKVSKKGTILNVGVEYGASLVCLHTGNPTALLIGIDLNNSKCEVSELAKLITANSLELVKDWKRPADLIFIDGGHSYDEVVSDIGFADNSPIGGLLAFHDCSDQNGTPHSSCEGVERAINDWKTREKDWNEIQHVDSIRVFERKYLHGLPSVVGTIAHIQSTANAGPDD
jgi:hypothetical protein